MSWRNGPCALFPHALVKGVCRACGGPIPARASFWCSRACSDRYWSAHSWSEARKAAVKRDGGRCVLCGSQEGLEVDHIAPRNGEGYRNGCHHHPENLRTLCHRCHANVTAGQAKERAGKRKQSKYVQPWPGQKAEK